MNNRRPDLESPDPPQSNEPLPKTYRPTWSAWVSKNPSRLQLKSRGYPKANHFLTYLALLVGPERGPLPPSNCAKFAGAGSSPPLRPPRRRRCAAPGWATPSRKAPPLGKIEASYSARRAALKKSAKGAMSQFPSVVYPLIWRSLTGAHHPSEVRRLGTGERRMGNDGETTSNERSKSKGRGHLRPQKCTDHSIASKRQQAHTRKRVPTALPHNHGRN
jgi:hypothetical protein